MSNTCPNTNTAEWRALVAELNNSRISAVKAYQDNGNEIPDINSDIVKEMKKISIKYGDAVEVVLDEDGKETDQYIAIDKNGKQLSKV